MEKNEWMHPGAECIRKHLTNKQNHLKRLYSIFRIVTGVVLTKQNGIVHMAIAERMLLPYAQAEITSAHDFYEPWKSSYEFFNIDDSDILPDVDYFALTYENRSINLGIVSVPRGGLLIFF